MSDMEELAPTAPQIATAPKPRLNLKSPLWIKILSGVLLFIFFYWFLTTLLPVAAVEAKYQYHKTLQTVFKANSLAEVILPDFDRLNFNENSQYRDYGIVIPAVFIDEPVVFNVDPNDSAAYTNALKQGIAHASGTGFPDNGGAGYYFAHSSSNDFRVQMNAVFYLLGKLKNEDEIFIWHDGVKHTYKVVNTRLTDPSDVGFLQDFYAKETIILQTCWPPGSTSKRLLVFGERVD